MAAGSRIANLLKASILGGIVILLALALTIASVYYQRRNDPLCRRLGAGFPLAFVCDASGESPLSSVGTIDWADRTSINIIGSLVDLLFYSLLLWGGLLLWQRFSEWRRYHAYLR
jgi:TRAP-type C4-dicarboxylate transport system permease large subunit